MSRPIIGLSTSQPTDPSIGWQFNGTPRYYSEAVSAVGGLPLMLPNLPELAADYAAQIDALILTGGVDVHPRYFGEHPRRGLGAVDERRDAFEAALYRAVRELGKPVFGICRGFQLMNALEGGTLHQHLPDAAGVWADHSQLATTPTLGHEVRFTPGSLLGQEHEETVLVNSHHHQGIDRLAPTLKATAYAPDDLIEGFEGDGLLGVQWHPEVLFQTHPHALGSFRAFMRLLGEKGQA